MKEILKEWKKYTKQVLKEGSMNDYLDNVKIIQNYISRQELPRNWNDLIDAATEVISNKNARYWTYAGQEGTPEKLKRTDEKSVWNVSVEIVGKNIKAEKYLPIGTKLQMGTREMFKINIPFLDPSSKPGLHPWWFHNHPEIGALLQTASNMVLSADNVIMLLLVYLTGGLAAAGTLGKVSELSGQLNNILKLKSASPAARSCYQEVEEFARRSFDNILTNEYTVQLYGKPIQVAFERLLGKTIGKGSAAIGKQVVQMDKNLEARKLGKALQKSIISGFDRIFAKYRSEIPELQVTKTPQQKINEI